ncbi:telomere-binding alpha subunit central domain-containing protein [Truncatella angustata]|uniref:Protection of telomeres protein 1 n=1 Tax=Truncatella angustata TaxID=152316 RepID=A0A9P8ZVK9_9PEZI|nr:telomere-binding alpha subunit central domain-containing protein [Truncatella angustata]KAH6648849.1 telomere-binding alpha subunit central domain-containing protein [Truncatella angustata]KAH8198782.1 hypothetical protein TruAng_007057 [Truncatella angustata]
MPPYGPVGSSARPRRRLAEKELPKGVVKIQDILNDEIQKGRFVSVIGLVKDMRAPMPTNGTDWKCTLTLMDKSTEDDDRGLIFNIFWPQEDMPNPTVGDVILVYSTKVYEWAHHPCIIANRATEITIFPASEIPRPPRSAVDAAKPTKSRQRAPTDQECKYVSWMYHASDKYKLPTAEEYQVNVDRSCNVKDKFAILKDAREHQFCNLVVRVVKDPYDMMDKVTLWVTDYTENDNFFRYTWDGSGIPQGQDGDPFGYVNVNANALSRSWPGPFGKRSMQVTCFEPHATRVREEVKAGDWVKLQNIQIKFGNNGKNLEGYLREDRGSFGSRKAVEVLETSGKDLIDDRLKEAIRRRRDYEKTAKEQKKSFTTKEGSGKRKADDNLGDTKQTAKERRNAQRMVKNKQLVQAENKREALLGLNEVIKCESLDEPVSPLSTILEPVVYNTTLDEVPTSISLPFTNAKYRTHVRVVDYRPRKLENFATWRKVTEYDMLSDFGGSSASESDDDQGTLDGFTGEKVWEWHFALQLEEAGSKAGKNGPAGRLWAMVNNKDAQCLLNMDACDLRANPDELSTLTEQLFKLWGNLEEHKEHESKTQIQSRRRLAANQAPPDSSDDENIDGRQDGDPKPAAGVLSNKPFTCCLRQYGIEVPESDPKKCDATKGKRYQRMFGLFGTKIS